MIRPDLIVRRNNRNGGSKDFTISVDVILSVNLNIENQEMFDPGETKI